MGRDVVGSDGSVVAGSSPPTDLELPTLISLEDRERSRGDLLFPEHEPRGHDEGVGRVVGLGWVVRLVARARDHRFGQVEEGEGRFQPCRRQAPRDGRSIAGRSIIEIHASAARNRFKSFKCGCGSSGRRRATHGSASDPTRPEAPLWPPGSEVCTIGTARAKVATPPHNQPDVLGAGMGPPRRPARSVRSAVSAAGGAAAVGPRSSMGSVPSIHAVNSSVDMSNTLPGAVMARGRQKRENGRKARAIVCGDRPRRYSMSLQTRVFYTTNT